MGFFHTLKTDRVNLWIYATRAEARRDLFGYIEGFYNPRSSAWLWATSAPPRWSAGRPNPSIFPREDYTLTGVDVSIILWLKARESVAQVREVMMVRLRGWSSSLVLSGMLAGSAQAQSAYTDPSGSGAIVGAVHWVEGTLLGTVATVVAVIAVASVGFLMLTGRMNWRYGATVILGCFILFGAASIVGGIQAAASAGY